MKPDRSLRGRLTRAGQEALADHCEALPDPARLLAQLDEIDLDLVAGLRDAKELPPPGQPSPVPYVAAAGRGPASDSAERGRAALREGQVAYAVLAGGQASRLRRDGPKGAYPIGPVTERSLFQILVEQVLRAGHDHGTALPLAVTTSAATDAAIRTFFERHDCFGLHREQLAFARQASLPVLDPKGSLMLATPDRLFVSPDGHGGAVLALETCGILRAWEEAGITTVCTFQVDNPLLRVVDEDMLGHHLESDAPITTKIILKREPGQKLGVVVTVSGKPAIVEYSELPDELAQSRDADGQLTFRLGSMAVHAFDLAFLRRALGTPLPLHSARKEIPCHDGRRPGVKYERFLFDLFPRADRITVVEALAEREYAPVKNADGVESPETCRAALSEQYRRWYREAGQVPPDEPELSPLDVMGPADLGP